MANAMVALANITLGSSQATVTFSSIPGTYRDLYVVINGQTTGALNNVQVQFNGDTAANYIAVRMLGDGTTAAYASSGTQSFVQWGDMGNIDTVITGSVMDYSATDKQKATLVRGNNAFGVASAYTGRWASTAAITSMKFTAGAGSFNTGVVISLFGIVS